MSNTAKKSRESSFRSVDLFVTLLCLFGTAISLFMFQRDLFKSLRSSSHLQVGTVTIRHNVVQRRFKDRVIWDRLFEESPVYDGDYVRIANLSGATLNLDENSVELDENTLIRIQKSGDKTTIDTFTGRLNVSSGEDSGIIRLHIGDRVVETSPGTSFSAYSGEDGIDLHITEGTALITRDGFTFELQAGDVIVQNAQGNEVLNPIDEERGFEQRLIYPPDNYTIETGQLPDLTFTWETDLPYDRRFQVSAQPDFSAMEIDESIRDYYYRDISLPPGIWYWRIVSKQDSLSQAIPTPARRFTIMLPRVVETAAPVQEVRDEPPVPPPPAQTQRQQPPAQPALFPAPRNRLPAVGYRIDAEQLRQKREIVFSWSAVEGANAYILSIFRESSPSRSRIFQTDPIPRLNYTFDNLELLDSGTFIWQVEAVYRSRNGRIERRGRPGENSFVLDVPRPGRVQTRDTGILYGTQ